MDELTEHIIHSGILRTKRIIDAFRAVDRAQFVPEDLRAQAYEDCPTSIGHMQTISQPSTVAFMLELLAPDVGHNVLDIGSGSGWTSALLGHIVGAKGSVLGLERVTELVTFGSDNLARTGKTTAHIENAGPLLGAPERAPFDRILVSAAASTFPNELVSQLTEGGVLVIPVRNTIWRVTLVEHQPIVEKYEGYVFVPLILES